MYKQSEPETIRALFGSIAANYDRGNAISSFGLHYYWNRELIRAVGSPLSLLDLCAGTGEIAFGVLKKNPQTGAILLDFCPEMLKVAEARGNHLRSRFSTLQADAQAIPLSDQSVDAVTIAYGIRNVENPEKCFQEVLRVLKPKGRFGILELTRPKTLVPRLGASCYTRYCVPFLGKLVAGNFKAYQYLARSVATFAPPEILVEQLQKSGFQQIKQKSLTLGIATLLIAAK